MKTTTTLVIMAMMSLISLSVYSATCTALANGNWTNPATWSCGSVPGCGDIIMIPAGITVDLDEHVNLDETSMPPCSDPVQIIIFGVLHFNTGKKMYLSCGSTVEIMVGGQIRPGTGGGSSNLLSICQEVEWQLSDGIITGYIMFGDVIPLALELISMDLTMQHDALQISWIVDQELLVDHYEIRVSADGYNWGEKRKISAEKDLTANKLYQYAIDLETLIDHEFIYVKLEYLTKDGERTFMAMRIIENEKVETTIYPNPVSNEESITVLSTHVKGNQTNIDVLSASGLIIKSIQTDPLNSSVSIPVSELEEGCYFIRIEGASEVFKFVKN